MIDTPMLLVVLQHSKGNSFIGACAVHSVYLFFTDRKKAGRKISIIILVILATFQFFVSL